MVSNNKQKSSLQNFRSRQKTSKKTTFTTKKCVN